MTRLFGGRCRFIALALALTVLGGCGTKKDIGVDWAALEEFEFSRRGTDRSGIYTYRVKKTEHSVFVRTSTEGGRPQNGRDHGGTRF